MKINNEMVFQSQLLRGALAAFAMLNLSALATSAADLAAYPEFATAMQTNGSNYGWKSYPVITQSGYKILLFRLTENELGAPLTDTKGPAVFLHGMFSDPADFVSRTDSASPSMPVQLAQQGYDVWIACTRGRTGTSEHASLDLLDPLQQ